jgi:hypothetical protein
MKQLATCLSLVILGSAAIAAGCSSSTPETSKDGGGTGGGGGNPGTLQALTPDGTGFVDVGMTGTTGIHGAWYAYGDGIGSDGTAGSSDCELKGGHMMSECSNITTPLFGSFMNTGGKMCTSGTVAKVIAMGTTTADYTNIWGAGIGLDLNNGGTADGGAGKQPFNTTMNGVVGIYFEIDSVPLATMRVEFPNKTNVNAPFWGGDQMSSPVKMGPNTIMWKDVKGPFYDPAPTPFDPTTLLSVQFHIPTTATSSAPYSFCVSNMSAILAK